MTIIDGYIRLNDIEIPLRSDDRGILGRKKNRYFIWKDKPYYLTDFVKLESRPGDCWVYPDFISAVEANGDIYPIYIEYVGSFAVNLYREGNKNYV